MSERADASGLPAERTGLAWSRTGLSGCVAALALARLASVMDAPVVAVAGLVSAALALAAFVEGSLRHDRRRTWLDDPDGCRALPRTAAATCAVVVALALAGLLLVVTG